MLGTLSNYLRRAKSGWDRSDRNRQCKIALSTSVKFDPLSTAQIDKKQFLPLAHPAVRAQGIAIAVRRAKVRKALQRDVRRAKRVLYATLLRLYFAKLGLQGRGLLFKLLSNLLRRVL